MKSLVIFLSALIIAQGLKQEETTIKDQYEEYVQEVLVPLINGYTELKNLIAEVKQYQQTQQISSIAFAERLTSLSSDCLPTKTPFNQAWDEDACQNLKASLFEALELGENVTGWALKTGLTIGREIFYLLNCRNINPFTAIKCVINYVNDIKDTVNTNKPVALKFKDQIAALVKELMADFKQCLDAQKKAHAVAEQIVVQAQLCDNMKPLRQH
uniref:Putative secreted protein n=1 Tax=Panstrongylus lignarius TaxID=156445 RepID=A0A224XSN8_9HEMI